MTLVESPETGEERQTGEMMDFDSIDWTEV